MANTAKDTDGKKKSGKAPIITAVLSGVAAILTALGGLWAQDSSNEKIFVSLFNVAKDGVKEAKDECEQVREEFRRELDGLRREMELMCEPPVAEEAIPMAADVPPECNGDNDCGHDGACWEGRCVPRPEARAPAPPDFAGGAGEAMVMDDMMDEMKTPIRRPKPKRAKDIDSFEQLQQTIQEEDAPWEPEFFE
jgi:hypothetical protein